MNIAAIAEEVYDRLSGDATLTTAATGGVWLNAAAEDVNMPYVVFEIGGGEQADSFESDGAFYTVTVAAYTEAGKNGFPTISMMLHRVFELLHRWVVGSLTDDTTYQGGMMVRQSEDTAPGADSRVWGYVQTYRVFISEA